MPTSTRVGCDLGNGLVICQSCSHRLSGEEIIVLQLRGARVVVFLECDEGDPGWCAMLHHLYSFGGWERWKNNSDYYGVGVRGCVSWGSIRDTSEERDGFCWHEKPRWFTSWRFDEDWMKLFWTILKPLPLEWSLHWWRKRDLMISMVIKVGMCAPHVVTSLRKCIYSL